MKSEDFYWLLINKTYMDEQTGVKRWNEVMPVGKNTWRTIFSSVRTTCKETKLREFQFKFLHRIIVTKKELFRFGIKTDNECLYCGVNQIRSIIRLLIANFPNILWRTLFIGPTKLIIVILRREQKKFYLESQTTQTP